MKNRLYRAGTALLALLLLFSGCAPKRATPDAKQPKIVATIFPVYDFARAVAGEENLTLLIRPGTEIHSFDPTPADILAIEECDVFLYIGGGIRTVGAGYPGFGLHGGQNRPAPDGRSGIARRRRRRRVRRAHLDFSQKCQENGVRHRCRLCSGGFRGEGCLCGECRGLYPKNRRDRGTNQRHRGARAEQNLVVADRFPFAYFAEEYGLTWYAAFGGCSAETDASAGVVISLIDVVREENLPAVFYLEMSNQNVSRIVSEQTGAEQLLLHSCHTISADDFKNGGDLCFSPAKKMRITCKRGLSK